MQMRSAIADKAVMTETTKNAPDATRGGAEGHVITDALHELNNLLSVIMTESELAVLVGSDKKRVQALRAVLTSAAEMRNIIARLQPLL
jgi:hypothetical protein